jgi:3-oxoacyl-[acyl-carrier protein] reductase
LTTRCAIVTGGGSGIGRAAALRLAKAGYAVALVGRRWQPLDQVAGEILASGGKAQAISADVSKMDEVAAIVAKTMEAYGRIDALINNAGSARVVPLHQMTPYQWHEALDANLSSAFYTTRAVWPIMQRQHASSGKEIGTIVNISSMSAKDPFSGLGAYGAAKAGLNLLTLATAREGADAGIRAVCIAPGAVDTGMFKSVMGDRPIPEGIALDPDDVAAMIVDAVAGSLRFSSGETIYVHRRPA